MQTPKYDHLEVTAVEQAGTVLQRYIPLICWAIVVTGLLLIPLKIISYGFVPGGDARRHFGKAFTDKTYQEIVVMRPEYQIDHSPGWEWLLRFLHTKWGWGTETLVSFSVIGLLLWIFFCGLPWTKYPEAWAGALLAQMVAIPELMTRFVQSRPYLITEGILITLLFAWSKPFSGRPGRGKLIVTTAGFALSCWMHGAWYLWVLPIAAFLLAREWRKAGWLTLCWAVGTFAGALLTGKPFVFLQQAVPIAGWISSEHVPSWMLVGELSPSYGEFATLALVAIVFLWRKQQNLNLSRLYCSPVLWLAASGWVLGFKVDRFWADWGMPAALVWLAMQFDEIAAAGLGQNSFRRVMAAGMMLLALVLTSSNDLDSRYTRNLRETFLDAEDSNLKDWMPGPGESSTAPKWTSSTIHFTRTQLRIGVTFSGSNPP